MFLVYVLHHFISLLSEKTLNLKLMKYKVATANSNMEQYVSDFLLSLLIIFINKHVSKVSPFVSHYFINPFTADDSNDYILTISFYN